MRPAMNTNTLNHELVGDILIRRFPNEWNALQSQLDEILMVSRQLNTSQLARHFKLEDSQLLTNVYSIQRMNAELNKLKEELTHLIECIAEKLESIDIRYGTEIGRMQDESGLVFSLTYLGYISSTNSVELRYLLDGPRFGFQRDTLFTEEQIKQRLDKGSIWWYEEGMPCLNIGTDRIEQVGPRQDEIVLRLNSGGFLYVKPIPFISEVLTHVKNVEFDVPSIKSRIHTSLHLFGSRMELIHSGEIKLKLNLTDGSTIFWSIQDAKFVANQREFIAREL